MASTEEGLVEEFASLLPAQGWWTRAARARVLRFFDEHEEIEELLARVIYEKLPTTVVTDRLHGAGLRLHHARAIQQMETHAGRAQHDRHQDRGQVDRGSVGLDRKPTLRLLRGASGGLRQDPYAPATNAPADRYMGGSNLAETSSEALE